MSKERDEFMDPAWEAEAAAIIHTTRAVKGSARLNPNATVEIPIVTTPSHNHFTHRMSPEDSYYDTHKDFGKPRYSLIPATAIRAMVKVLTMGHDKYGGSTWKQTPDGEQRYTESFFRHAVEVLEYGPRVRDEESGHLHLAHCLVDAAFTIWFMGRDGVKL